MKRTLSLVIRKAQRKDRVDWISLRGKLWPEDRAFHKADVDSHFGKRGSVCFLAFYGAKAIGFAEASIRPFANGCRSQPVPFLEGLWVEASCRRQKVGRDLVRAVEGWARAKGFHELGSDAYLSAKISHRAHRAYGFRETERVVYFRKSL